jgi:hypothetical protein
MNIEHQEIVLASKYKRGYHRKTVTGPKKMCQNTHLKTIAHVINLAKS